jgi:hypothetical protein
MEPKIITRNHNENVVLSWIDEVLLVPPRETFDYEFMRQNT